MATWGALEVSAVLFYYQAGGNYILQIGHECKENLIKWPGLSAASTFEEFPLSVIFEIFRHPQIPPSGGLCRGFQVLPWPACP